MTSLHGAGGTVSFGLAVDTGPVLGLSAGTVTLSLAPVARSSIGLGELWPESFQCVRVFGRFVDSNGAPTVGTISFKPDPDALVVLGDGATVNPVDTVATLDVDGAFSVYLPATNDPDVQPTRWTYTVRESWGAKRTYHISVPLGDDFDIVTETPVPSSIGVVKYFGPRGEDGTPGEPGVSWIGTWAVDVDYSTRDGVERHGSSYVALQPNTGADPEIAVADWMLLAEAGVDGAPGTADLGPVTLSGVAAAGNSIIADDSTHAHWGPAAADPGTVIMYAGDPADPLDGYLLCNGTEVSRTTFAALFAKISTRWGAGDGSTTFNLPDGRDVFVRGSMTPGDEGGASTHTHGAGTYAAAGHVHALAGHAHSFDDGGHSHELTNRGQARLHVDGDTMWMGRVFTAFTANRRKAVTEPVKESANSSQPDSIGLQGDTEITHADGTTASDGGGNTGSTAPAVAGTSAATGHLPPWIGFCFLIKT